MDRTFQRQDLGRHGFACKIVPEYSEIKQKTFTGCLHRRGTKKFPIKAQSIIPAPLYFKVGIFSGGFRWANLETRTANLLKSVYYGK